MWIKAGQTLTLVDRSRHELATVRVDRLEGNTLSGELTPGHDYSLVRELFHQWITSANDQLLTEVDRLDAEIVALGLRLVGPGGFEANVADFQPGEDMFTLRIETELSRNGTPVIESRAPVRSHTPGRN
jgi:hypothetical protein